MTVLTLTIADQTFDKKSAEVAYLAHVLDLLKTEIGDGQGTRTSGNIVGTNPAGVPNTSLGSWTYTPSATKP
jgi:hypothetical protein